MTHLVHNENVPGKDIAILSQYRSQCAKIVEALKTKGPKMSSVTVTTVIESQGNLKLYI